jgi:hypothetical protein
MGEKGLTKYGPEMTQEICKHLSAGMGRVDSCILADIHYDTFCEWMKRAEFSEAIKKAETSCKERNLVLIQRAAPKSWQAAAWLLERKYPSEFAQRVAHSNADGSNLNLHQAAILIINGPEAINGRRAELPAGSTHQLGSASTSAG